MLKRLRNKILSLKFYVTINNHRRYLFIADGDSFAGTTPNPEKTQKVVDYVKRTGYLDKPIIINQETRVLIDGYRRYIVAKK